MSEQKSMELINAHRKYMKYEKVYIPFDIFVRLREVK